MTSGSATMIAAYVASDDTRRRLEHAARLLDMNGYGESAETMKIILELGVEHGKTSTPSLTTEAGEDPNRDPDPHEEHWQEPLAEEFGPEGGQISCPHNCLVPTGKALVQVLTEPKPFTIGCPYHCGRYVRAVDHNNG